MFRFDGLFSPLSLWFGWWCFPFHNGDKQNKKRDAKFISTTDIYRVSANKTTTNKRLLAKLILTIVSLFENIDNNKVLIVVCRCFITNIFIIHFNSSLMAAILHVVVYADVLFQTLLSKTWKLKLWMIKTNKVLNSSQLLCVFHCELSN